jgi:hypothetical protein
MGHITRLILARTVIFPIQLCLSFLSVATKYHIFWLFTILRPAQEYFTYMETSPLPGLQNIGLCSALTAFEQRGIFIVPHLLWHGTSVFPVSSSYDTQGNMENLSPRVTYMYVDDFHDL